MSRSAVVMGGGVAGIAAAVRLAEAGIAVTLIETRKRLGGRATSHIDQQTGGFIDNCQHVLLGCCTNLIDLYERLGVAGRIEWHRELHFFDKQHHHDVLRSSCLPAPMHLSTAMLRFGTLNMHDKIAISEAMWSIIRMGRRARWELGDLPFSRWLAQHNQTERAIERYWAPVVIGACNATPDKLSTTYALQVFQDGFLAHREAYVMGTATVPLVELYEAVTPSIEQTGGAVLTGRSVQDLRFDGGRITGVELSGGQCIEADHYISALPFDRLHTVAGPVLCQADARLGRLGELQVSPILGIHMWFERPPIDWPHMVLVDSPLQWVFNKGADPSGTGHVVHGVVSASEGWVGLSAEEILTMAREELADYEPGSRQAGFIRGRVIKEKRATFAAVPGVDAMRPGTTGEVENLLLAGDWCATGWPATMEGAVRSGYAAAEAVTGTPLRVPDLPASWLYRCLSPGE
jgi:squalene-associated FAD-dependent desaturase